MNVIIFLCVVCVFVGHCHRPASNFDAGDASIKLGSPAQDQWAQMQDEAETWRRPLSLLLLLVGGFRSGWQTPRAGRGVVRQQGGVFPCSFARGGLSAMTSGSSDGRNESSVECQDDLDTVFDTLTDLGSNFLFWPKLNVLDSPAENWKRIRDWSAQVQPFSAESRPSRGRSGGLAARDHPVLGPALGMDIKQRPRAIFFYDGG